MAGGGGKGGKAGGWGGRRLSSSTIKGEKGGEKLPLTLPWGGGEKRGRRGDSLRERGREEGTIFTRLLEGGCGFTPEMEEERSFSKGQGCFFAERKGKEAGAGRRWRERKKENTISPRREKKKGKDCLPYGGQEGGGKGDVCQATAEKEKGGRSAKENPACCKRTYLAEGGRGGGVAKWLERKKGTVREVGGGKKRMELLSYEKRGKKRQTSGREGGKEVLEKGGTSLFTPVKGRKESGGKKAAQFPARRRGGKI